MNINDFRNFVLFVIKKSQSGGNPSPTEFNLALERAFMRFVMSRYGNQEEYQPGNPVPRIAWQQSQKISDDLDFLLTKLIFIIPTTGKLTYPDGSVVKDINGTIAPKYLHSSSLRFDFVTNTKDTISSKEIPIDVLRDSEIGDVTSSEIVHPTRRFPVCAFYDTFIQIYPKNLQQVIFSYLRMPIIPVWGFTIDSNGRPEYDASASVDIEAPDQVINEIAFNLLSFMSISIREQAVYQASEQYNAQGV